MTDQTDHDLLITLDTRTAAMQTTLEDIKDGKTQICVIHTQRLENHWTHIKALWAVVAVVAIALLGTFIKHLFE